LKNAKRRVFWEILKNKNNSENFFKKMVEVSSKISPRVSEGLMTSI